MEEIAFSAVSFSTCISGCSSLRHAYSLSKVFIRMYSHSLQLHPTPSVTYYSNTKKNAVAAKITDTAVENLMKRINAEYLEATLGRLFESTGSLAGDLDSDDAVDRMIEQLVG